MIRIAAKVVAGDNGWYVEDPYEFSNCCSYYGPILSLEMAHEVAEEVDAVRGRMIHEAMRAVREHWKEVEPWPHAAKLVHASRHHRLNGLPTRYLCGALTLDMSSEAAGSFLDARVTCEACRRAVREQEGGP